MSKAKWFAVRKPSTGEIIAKSARKAKDKLHKACEKASETRERTLCRQEQNRMHKASMRESETFEQTVHRQEQNRMRMASMRESETFEQAYSPCSLVLF